MYSSYPSMRPRRPAPNYRMRRLVALSGTVLVLLLVFSVLRSCGGGGGDGGTTTVADGSGDADDTTATSAGDPAALEAPPECAEGDEPSVYARPQDWYRTIVDPTYRLPEDYEPPDLVSTSKANYAPDFLIREFIADDLNAMRNAILDAGVPEVVILAAYRSVAEQNEMADGGSASTALGGHSEHHLGTTIDYRLIGQDGVDQSFGATATGEWLAANSWRYGFLLTHPEGKDDVTCSPYEPWHFRFVGIDLARRVQESGLTLREYLWHWEVIGTEPGQAAGAPTTIPADGQQDAVGAAAEGAEDGDGDSDEPSGVVAGDG